MDRQKLRQVFENLLINAMEAMGEAGRVAVLVELLAAPRGASVPYPTEPERDRDPWQTFEQFAVVRVVDSGPGIRPEDRDRVFYPFFTTKQHGSGVGLSMAKKIVDSHRGLIDLDDAPGGGALFTVRLPMVLENRRSDRT
jgi:two-component system nitrogen regulation sensor histidine kinase GlnL